MLGINGFLHFKIKHKNDLVVYNITFSENISNKHCGKSLTHFHLTTNHLLK